MVSLADFRGRPVVLAFYPADWSPVCGDQMALYNEILPEFHRHEAQLVGISVDGVWCHAAFAGERKLHFRCSLTSSPRARSRAVTASIATRMAASAPCSSSTAPGRSAGATSRRFGINPGADGILEALDSLTTLCSPRTSSIHDPPFHSHRSPGSRPERPTPAMSWSNTATTNARTAASTYTVLKEVQAAMGDRLRFVFRNFPLAEMPHALRAAEFAEAAATAGRFWEATTCFTRTSGP